MWSLISTIAMDVSPLQRQRLALVDAEDFGPVIRKVREESTKQGGRLLTRDTEAGVLALKQYYAVALLDPFNEHAVSDHVDPYWHAHILHTTQYTRFCERVFGQYIHHEPLDHADTKQVARVAELYRYTYGVFCRMFSYVDGDFYPEDLPDSRTICTHYRVTDSIVRAESMIPPRHVNA